GRLLPILAPRPAFAEGGDPYFGLRLAATLCYAWCPLLIWEFGNNAHNDGMVAFWILVALWCHLRGLARQAQRGQLGFWWWAAVAALVLAGLVKAPALLLLPAYLVLIAEGGPGPRGWPRRLAVGAQAAGIGL